MTNQQQLKVFPKRIGGTSGIQDMCDWINENNLVDQIVSVIHQSGLGYLILYKAFEKIKEK
jgi:hypothetical protein